MRGLALSGGDELETRADPFDANRHAPEALVGVDVFDDEQDGRAGAPRIRSSRGSATLFFAGQGLAPFRRQLAALRLPVRLFVVSQAFVSHGGACASADQRMLLDALARDDALMKLLASNGYGETIPAPASVGASVSGAAASAASAVVGPSRRRVAARPLLAMPVSAEAMAAARGGQLRLLLRDLLLLNAAFFNVRLHQMRGDAVQYESRFERTMLKHPALAEVFVSPGALAGRTQPQAPAARVALASMLVGRLGDGLFRRLLCHRVVG